MELDLKIFMSHEVPNPNAKPSPMLATKRYKNLAKMASTVDAFSTSVPFRACRKGHALPACVIPGCPFLFSQEIKKTNALGKVQSSQPAIWCNSACQEMQHEWGRKLHVGISISYLHSSQQGHGGGIIDDAFSKDQGIQQRHLILLQDLQDCHTVSGSKDDS